MLSHNNARSRILATRVTLGYSLRKVNLAAKRCASRSSHHERLEDGSIPPAFVIMRARPEASLLVLGEVLDAPYRSDIVNRSYSSPGVPARFPWPEQLLAELLDELLTRSLTYYSDANSISP